MAKKYALIVDENQVKAVEINGVRYQDVADIPDPQDHARVARLLAAWPDLQPGSAKLSDPLQKIILPLFAGLTTLLLLIFAVSTFSVARAAAREVSAPGRVIELTTRRTSDGQIFSYPVVEFPLADGTLYTVQVGEGNWPPAYDRGEEVIVRYDRQQPREARIQSTGSDIARWTLPIIMGVLGAAFLGGTFFVRWIFKQ